ACLERLVNDLIKEGNVSVRCCLHQVLQPIIAAFFDPRRVFQQIHSCLLES
ncbi:unnamed protein product, partial [Arabidopsis halleri]